MSYLDRLPKELKEETFRYLTTPWTAAALSEQILLVAWGRWCCRMYPVFTPPMEDAIESWFDPQRSACYFPHYEKLCAEALLLQNVGVDPFHDFYYSARYPYHRDRDLDWSFIYKGW